MTGIIDLDILEKFAFGMDEGSEIEVFLVVLLTIYLSMELSNDKNKVINRISFCLV